MTIKKRKFISLYFSDIPLEVRTKRYITIAFDAKSVLYKKCKDLSASEIKKLVDLSSYGDLVYKANVDNRTLGNYIKHKLSSKLL